MGSSPLTRGKQAASRGCCVAARLIPAHAGKTPPRSGASQSAPAHPRSQEENWICWRSRSTAIGSSPLTRGKLRSSGRATIRAGFIPTHAGKTTKRSCPLSGAPAHPRSRGENHSFREGNTRTQGSSPLTRGKHEYRSHVGGESGLIPAHAGKTPGHRGRSTPERAHPRSRREKLHLVTVDEAWAGSSPPTGEN